MPMDAKDLEKKMLKSMRGFIKSVASNASPQKFQAEISKAIAVGIVKSMKGAKGTGAVAASAKGPSVGIKSLKPNNMAKEARKYFQQKVGSVGSAFVPIFTAIFSEICTHMLKVKIESTSGYGGVITTFTSISPSIVAKNIINALPSSVRSPVNSSRTGKIMFEALAAGFITGLTKDGKPTPIPAGGDSTGPTKAKFS